MIPLEQESDPYSYNADGEFCFDQIPITRLIKVTPTPLHIYSEATILKNIALMGDLLTTAWGSSHNIKYSIKSTGLLDIAKICVSAGAGLECFGSGELDIALKTGVAPEKILLNGSAKNLTVLNSALTAGVTISIDNLQDVDYLIKLANGDLSSVNYYIRLKIVPDVSVTPGFLSATDLANLINFAQSEKWGASVELAVEIFEKLSTRGANLIGLNAHLGRVLKQDWSFAFWGDHYGKAVAAFIDRTGASPKYLDIGGGWTRSRDPMPSAYKPRKPATVGLVEFTQALRIHLNGLTELPVIEVEIGRFIVGNAAATIAKVVNHKADLGHTWLHIDISTNFLLRIDTSKYKYVVLPAKQTEETADTAVLVGETCVDSTINDQFKYVGLVEGDLVIILDTGMYTISAANKFNSIELPTVIISKLDGALEPIII